ncbi:MAG: hypothetical protein EOP00_13575 [Pedobacter sp.]|nr:MAG: hypothetical protein EOP00_13575 [Pedobacter sp.]
MLIKKVFGKVSNKFIVYGLGQAFNLVTPVLIAPYLIFVCNIDGFGKIGTAFAFALFFILIVDYGFDIKGIKKISESRNSPEQLEHELVTTLYTKFFLFLFAALVGTLFVFLLPYFRDEYLLFLFSLIIVFAQVFNPVWFLQGLEDFYTSSIVNASSKVIYVALVFTCIRISEDYIYVNLLLGLSSLTVNIIGLIYIFRKNKFKFLTIDFKLISQTLKNDFSLCISQLFLSLRQISPVFIVGYFFGYSVAGQYKIIDQIISLYRTFSQVFLRFFYPQLSFRLSQNSRKALLYWKRYAFVLFCGVLISSLLLFIFTEQVLLFFRVENNVIPQLKGVFQMALIVPLSMGLSLPLEQLMFGLLNSRLYFKITFFVTVFNLVTILVFIKFFDLSGIIASIFLSEILFVYLYYQGAFKKLASNEN